MAENTQEKAISYRGPATVYNYYCNQAYKGGPFGSSVTNSGSDSLHEDSKDNQFTGAVLRQMNTEFVPGDIVIARNNVTNQQVLLALDDTGQGDGKNALIDLPEGPVTDALGITATRGENKRVIGAENAQDITFTKVAHAPTDDKEVWKQTILKVGEINTRRDESGKNIAKLSELKDRVTFVTDDSGKTIDTEQVVSTTKVDVTNVYAQNSLNQETRTRDRLSRNSTWDKTKTKEQNEEEQHKNMMNQLAAMPPEQQLMFAIMALICSVLTGQDLMSTFNSLSTNTTLSENERSLARTATNAITTGDTNKLSEEWKKTELGGAKLEPLPTNEKFDANNYSVPVRNPMSGEVKQLDIVKNGVLQQLPNKDLAAYMLYVNDKAANARAQIPDAKTAVTIDIAHFTSGKFEGADQKNGISETMTSAFMADRLISHSKENGIKPYTVQENSTISEMLQRTVITNEKPDFSNYGMTIRANTIDANAAKYPQGFHLAVSNHFDAPETTNAPGGTFGLINHNPLSAEFGKTAIKEIYSRGGIDYVQKENYLSTSNPTGLQRVVRSPFVLFENGSGDNPNESNKLATAAELDKQARAEVGGMIKFHIQNDHPLANSPAVEQARTELKPPAEVAATTTTAPAVSVQIPLAPKDDKIGSTLTPEQKRTVNQFASIVLPYQEMVTVKAEEKEEKKEAKQKEQAEQDNAPTTAAADKIDASQAVAANNLPKVKEPSAAAIS